MTHYFLYLIFFLPLWLTSCYVNSNLPKHPCQSEEYLKDISHYSEAELKRLARIFESSSYAAAGNSGCRAALLGRLYMALDRMSEASSYFLQASQKLPEISEYFLLARAHAEVKKQNFDDAHNIVNALLAAKGSLFTSQFSLRLRQILADIAVQKKDNQQIIKTHEQLLKQGYGEDEALLFNLATALANVGEHTKANEVYKKLLISFPLSSGAKRAEQLQDLAQYQLDLKQIEKRFDKMIEHLAFDQIVKDSDLLVSKKHFNEDEKSDIAAAAVKSLIYNNQFAAALKRGYQRVNQKKPRPKDFESYAFSLAKVGRMMDAAEYYGKFITAAKNKEDRARGCFFRGFSFYEANLYPMALFSWQACHPLIKNSEYYENYLWYQSLAFMLNGNFNKAHSLINDARKLFPKSHETEKYQFFLGYSLNQLNKKPQGEAYLRELSKKPEPTYYVLLARRNLGIKQFADDIVKNTSANAAPKTTNGECENALMLFRIGFKDEARDLVLRSKAKESEKAALLQHMGFYHDAWRRAHLLGPSWQLIGNKLKPKEGFHLTFALPHREIIQEASKKYAVSDSILYAIMQTESGFAEHAQSSRGALGLMQMMPFVAKELSQKLKLKEYSKENLKDPKIAIELGAIFVAMLQRQFNDPHLVIAAYNAGSHQVEKWLSGFGHLPSELFVERIPFKQTRDYVKKVLPSEGLYRAIKGKDLRLAL
jgi:soluble lytic murein transglycosylase